MMATRGHIAIVGCGGRSWCVGGLSVIVSACVLKMLCFVTQACLRNYTAGKVMSLLFSCHFNNMPVFDSFLGRIYTLFSYTWMGVKSTVQLN